MNILNFKTLPFDKKCDTITNYSTYLGYRAMGDTKVFLYGYKCFFIEVFYSSSKSDILMINSFNDVAGLEDYLELISLNDLN